MKAAIRGAATLLFLFLGGLAEAVPIAVSVVGFDASRPPVEARVEASRADGISHVQRVTVAGTATVNFDLEKGGPWRIAVRARGYWVPELLTNVDESQPISLTAWPAGELRGELLLPKGEPDVKELAVGFVPALRASAGAPSGHSSCDIRDARFFCVVPAGSFDLKLRARGYISHFVWGVTIRASGTVDTGRLRLQRGASLVGIVRFNSRLASWEKCSVSLRPEAETRRASISVKVNNRGFFAAEGVPPGRYTVEARHPGLLSESRDVTILPDVEANLREPIVLSDPRPFNVSITPPLDPAGKAWGITIVEIGQPSRTLQHSSATEEGRWATDRLVNGKLYTVAVSTNGGSAWWAETLEGEIPETLFVTMERHRVVGTVRLGNAPLRATIVFGGETGAIKVPIESDDSGIFEGDLPRLGSWRVSVLSSEPPVKRTLQIEVRKRSGEVEARADIALPDTVIVGEVLDGEGRPVADSVVRVLREDGDSMSARTTTGNFRFGGLGPGRYVLSADASIDGEVAKSEPLAVTVEESVEPEFQRLTVEIRDRYIGRVVTATGAPVPGALVEEVPPANEPWGSFFHSATTDLDGKFELRLKKHAREAGLAVHAPGYALRILRVALVRDGAFDVVVNRNGGNLRILFPSSEKRSGSAANRFLRLSHSGLLYWPKQASERFVTTERADGRVLSINDLEPGDYTICGVSLAEAVLVAAGAPPPGLCASGFLPAFGEATLRMPSP